MLKAQIRNRLIRPEESLAFGIHSFSKKPRINVLPSFDIKKVLKEDSLEKCTKVSHSVSVRLLK
jgi:hypothetical protein